MATDWVMATDLVTDSVMATDWVMDSGSAMVKELASVLELVRN